MGFDEFLQSHVAAANSYDQMIVPKLGVNSYRAKHVVIPTNSFDNYALKVMLI